MPIKRKNACNWNQACCCFAMACAFTPSLFAQSNNSGAASPPSLPTLAASKSVVGAAVGTESSPNSPSVAPIVTVDPNQIVLAAMDRAVWGPPIACKVYQRSRAYDQQVIVSGEYKALGGGTSQFRFSARVSSGQTTLDTIQVSDGRLMYTQFGLDEPPLRVNIDQVRQKLGNAIHRGSENPEVSICLAIGGHPELLRNLYHRYRWYTGKAGQIRGVDVWQLFGELRSEPPKLAGSAPLDVYTPQPETGASLPTEVRLTLGRSAALAYFPYMVEYFQRKKRADGQPAERETVCVLEHTEPTTSVNLSEKDFIYNVRESVPKIDDETLSYVPTREILGQSTFPFR